MNRYLVKLIRLCCCIVIILFQCHLNMYADETIVSDPVEVSGTGECTDSNQVTYHLHFDKGDNEQEVFSLPQFVQFEDIYSNTYSINGGILTINFMDTDYLDIDISGTLLNLDNTVWYITDDCAISIDANPIIEEDQTPIFDEDIYVNPNYPDTVISRPFLLQSAPDTEEEIEYTSIEEAGLYLREQMKERNSSVTFRFVTTSTDYRGLLKSIYEYAYMHTGVPDEGDYLYFQYGGYYCKITGYVSQGVSHVIYTNTITYYSDASMEEIVNHGVSQVLGSLQLEGCTDYEKVKRIHDYVSTNVDYSTDTSSDYTKYTAYGALVDGKAVCQGYSVLFYRLCLEAGIDARIISGTGNGTPHSWNIVLLDGWYYNIDTTWDHNSKDLFFLKSDADFHGHTRNEKYATDAFYQQYPMSPSSYDLDEMYEINLPETISLYPDESRTIDVSFYPAKPDKEIHFEWTVEDESICSVKDGVMNGIKPGQTIIHVKADNGSEASCIVTVNDYQSLVIMNTSQDVVYDGKEHKWIPLITDSNGNELKEGEDYTVEYNTDDFVNAGTIKVTIHGLKYYQRELNDAYSILPATLIVNTESASKKYDGSPLMCPKGSVDGLVNHETITLIVNGKITDVGSVPNTYSLVWDGTAKKDNYIVQENLGILTIEKSSKTPSTGVYTFRNGWIFMGILSIVGIIFLTKRR